MIQVEIIKPYKNEFGNTKPVGHKLLVSESMARTLISVGRAKLYTDTDLIAEAKRALDDHRIAQEIHTIDTPKPSIWTRIKNIFSLSNKKIK